jgi:hypothetical protein
LLVIISSTWPCIAAYPFFFPRGPVAATEKQLSSVRIGPWLARNPRRFREKWVATALPNETV